MPCAALRLFRLVLVAALAVVSTSAFATAQRTFVASTGNDANPCTLPLPCRQFAAAVAKTAVGGEVIVLDSAGYGPVTITQSVSLIAPVGVYAGISVFTGDGVTINGPGIIVILRGLAINGQGGANGIVIAAANTVHVENCVIAHLAAMGISQSAGNLVLKDSIVRDNGNIGVFVQDPAVATLDHVRLDNNNTGLAAEYGGQATMHESLVTGSPNINVVVVGASHISGRSSSVTISRSVIASSPYGIYVSADANDGPAIVDIADSTITGNGYGMYAVCAVLCFGATIVATRNTISVNGTGLDLAGIAKAVLDGNSFYQPIGTGLDIVTGATTKIATPGNNNTTSEFSSDINGIVQLPNRI
jgi:hypothetical protein